CGCSYCLAHCLACLA
ncbi:voltage gated chloride channel family protein, partial [Vibrio parahaemolyticus V-223/04]